MGEMGEETMIGAPGGPASKKVEKAPAPPPAIKCADCGKKFAGRTQTRWDVHLGGGNYATVCTACFEKRDSRWPTPTEKTKSPSSGRSGH